MRRFIYAKSASLSYRLRHPKKLFTKVPNITRSLRISKQPLSLYFSSFFPQYFIRYANEIPFIDKTGHRVSQYIYNFYLF